MMKKFLLPMIVLLFVTAQVQAQDPHFSQYYANALYLNPAMAGSNIGPRVILNYRNQWPSIPGTFVTYTASYDQYFDKLSGGIGVQLLADRSGEAIFKHNMASFMYSNNLNLNRDWSLKTGFQAAYIQKSINWANLVFPDQLDARLGIFRQTSEPLPSNGVTNANYFDFSAGMVIFNDQFYAGVAAHHLTQPNESLIPDSDPDANLPMKITAHVGGNIVVKEGNYRQPSTIISPNVIFQLQGTFNTVNAGFYANRGPVTGGVWYRYSGLGSSIGGTSDAFAVLAGVQQGIFRFGYSYDITTSKLRDATTGSHEISVQLLFEEDKRARKKPIKKIQCPAF